ncbi:MAG: T9SS type A sorting domain-containing protein [Bacteroidia bacterium]
MIKNLLLPILTCLFISGIAQNPITFTSNDLPNEYDTVQVSVVAPEDFINVPAPTITGASQTWDYSSLTPNYQQFEIFDSPLDFTTPYNYLFNPFNTTYGRNNYEFSAIPLPNTDISAAYDFFKESSSQLKQIGAGFIINGVPLPFMYDNADILYELPMTFGSNSSSFYKYGLEIPGVGYYGQSGTRTNVVDGWGSLTTPFGTFQTIRLKSTVDAVDTVYNNSLQGGANIPRPLKHEYKWLANGKKIPVLKIETTVIAGNETISTVRYIDSSRSDVPQLGVSENTFRLKSNIYPNPCVNELNIAYQLPANSTIKMTLTDMVGKTVVTLLNEKQNTGSYKQRMNTSDLIPGVYFLILQTGNYKETRKIIVSK